jgi:glycine/D-amino acid oxidase-like deaminating enzyme
MPFDYDYLSTDIESDIAIIGGGISGALCAYHLPEAGINCLVIDAREIGQGSTCASTSLLQYELDIPLHELIKKIGKLKAERVYRLTGDAILKLVQIMDTLGFPDYEQCKSLYFSGDDHDDKFLINEWNARKNAGFSVELISQKSIKKDYGLEAKFGILSSLGATTDAYGLTHALFQHCIKKGMPVFARTRIAEIENGDKIVLKTDKGFCIRVKKVIQPADMKLSNSLAGNGLILIVLMQSYQKNFHRIRKLLRIG